MAINWCSDRIQGEDGWCGLPDSDGGDWRIRRGVQVEPCQRTAPKLDYFLADSQGQRATIYITSFASYPAWRRINNVYFDGKKSNLHSRTIIKVRFLILTTNRTTEIIQLSKLNKSDPLNKF
jgi:hypothetical protein